LTGLNIVSLFWRWIRLGPYGRCGCGTRHVNIVGGSSLTTHFSTGWGRGGEARTLDGIV
jgi:hypothetical protein